MAKCNDLVICIGIIFIVAAILFLAFPWFIVGLVWLFKASGIACYSDWVFQNFLF